MRETEFFHFQKAYFPKLWAVIGDTEKVLGRIRACSCGKRESSCVQGGEVWRWRVLGWLVAACRIWIASFLVYAVWGPTLLAGSVIEIYKGMVKVLRAVVSMLACTERQNKYRGVTDGKMSCSMDFGDFDDLPPFSIIQKYGYEHSKPNLKQPITAHYPTFCRTQKKTNLVLPTTLNPPQVSSVTSQKICSPLPQGSLPRSSLRQCAAPSVVVSNALYKSQRLRFITKAALPTFPPRPRIDCWNQSGAPLRTRTSQNWADVHIGGSQPNQEVIHTASTEMGLVHCWSRSRNCDAHSTSGRTDSQDRAPSRRMQLLHSGV